MNKKQLLEQIRLTLGGTATPGAAELALDSVIRAISDGLQEDGVVRLANFGTFEQREVRARRLTLPHNGESLTLPQRKVMRFRPSPEHPQQHS